MVTCDVGDQVEVHRVKRARTRTLDQIVGVLVMLLIRDKQPDIVQHRGRVQNPGILVRKLVQFTQLFEKGQGEPGYLLAVVLIVVVFGANLLDGFRPFRDLAPGALESRIVLSQQVHHQSISEAASGHEHIVQFQVVHD